MRRKIGVIVILILFSLSIQFVSAGILCNWFNISCDKNLRGELGSSNPIAVEGSCADGIDNDNDGRIDYPNDRGCAYINDNNEFGEPFGYLDGIRDCNNIIGWSCDPDNFNEVVDVHLYKDGPVGAGGSLLSIVRADVQRESAVGNLCGGNSNHGFSFVLPDSLKDSKSHSVYAYGINIGTPSNNVELNGNPKEFSCEKISEGTSSGSGDSSQKEINCEEVCENIGTRSEGFYNSCTGELIEYTQCGSEVNCTDSDGGRNLEIKGITCLGNNCQEDFCDSGYLREYYCLNDGMASEGLNCTNGCNDGACVEEDQTCQLLIDEMTNPENFNYNGIDYELVSSGNSSSNYVSHYYNKWVTNKDTDNSRYFIIQVDDFKDREEFSLDILKEQVKEGFCKQKFIYSGNKGNVVYVCDSSSYNDPNLIRSVNVYWVNKNILFDLYSFSNDDLLSARNNYDKLIQEDSINVIEKLKNNKPGELYNFDLPFKIENFIERIFSICSSSLEYDYNICVPNWNCKIEPVICPPHGEQKEICVDYNGCNEDKKDINSTIFCSPGICSGCFVPRYEGASDLANTCIPYGTRLEFSDVLDNNYKSYEYEMNREGEGYFNISINEDNFEIDVVKDVNSVDFSEYIEVNGIKYNLVEGEKFIGRAGDEYDIKFFEDNIEGNYKIIIKDIYYSENPEERYLLINFNEKFNGYCDPFSGDIKQQRVKDINGNWAKCQNNYECESNLCSSGECVDFAGAIKQSGRVKTLIYKVICRLSSLFGDTDYNQCLVDNLGDNFGTSSSNLNSPAILEA